MVLQNVPENIQSFETNLTLKTYASSRKISLKHIRTTQYNFDFCIVGIISNNNINTLYLRLFIEYLCHCR